MWQGENGKFCFIVKTICLPWYYTTFILKCQYLLQKNLQKYKIQYKFNLFNKSKELKLVKIPYLQIIQ